jgi:hypothetical protein
MDPITIPCICSGSPHESDTIRLRDKLGLFEAASIRNAILVFKANDPNSTAADVLAVMGEASILAGVESWSLVDEKGKPIEVTRQAIRDHLLSDVAVAIDLGDKAWNAYEGVMLPLLERAFKPSPASPTRPSTSRTNGSPQKPPKPSKRSSISTIPTAATETTSKSLVGVSSSSQSSESAA